MRPGRGPLGLVDLRNRANLALAAGLALPFCYPPRATAAAVPDPAGLQALAWAYGGSRYVCSSWRLRCLWRAERLHSSWSHT